MMSFVGESVALSEVVLIRVSFTQSQAAFRIISFCKPLVNPLVIPLVQ